MSATSKGDTLLPTDKPRFWLYDKEDFDRSWRPWIGMDEFYRYTLVLPWFRGNTLVIALWKCRSQECREDRATDGYSPYFL